MGQSEGIDSSKACPQTPTLERKLFGNTVRREMIIAVSLAFILTTTGLVYVLMLPSSPIIPIPLQLTPHDSIAIDGDADFSATALLEGWPGDGSAETPYIIDGLDIDRGGVYGNCISIINTRVNFTISNCRFINADAHPPTVLRSAGICLRDVMNAKLLENIFDSNCLGIALFWSSSNTVANNTCNNNDIGIHLENSESNTVANNTCSSNGLGIQIRWSSSSNNIVANNTCSSNGLGIQLSHSDSNTVADNTCNNNRIGIYLDDESYSNTVANNTCLNNTEHDIIEEFEPEATEPEEDGTGEDGTEEDGTEEDGTEEFLAEENVPEVFLLVMSVGFSGFIIITLLGGLIVGKHMSEGE